MHRLRTALLGGRPRWRAAFRPDGFAARSVGGPFLNNGCYYGAWRTFVGSLRYSW
ncbi:hypothetical protein QE379_003764 [Sphingomonas sp. SORGH_AS 879]|nr:hypothetical protein [Sphingomonas sp. SORGH_AS_0879]